jgi:AsmA protein
MVKRSFEGYLIVCPIPARKRKYFHPVVVLPVIVVLAGIIALLLFGASYWLSRYVPLLEHSINDATGYEVRIKGPPLVRLLPVPAISLSDIELSHAGPVTLDIRKIEARIELLPLLRRELKIHSIDADHVQLRLPVDTDGRPAVPPLQPRPKKNTAQAFRIKLDSFDQVALHHSDFIATTKSGDELYSLKNADIGLYPANIASALARDTPEELVVSISLNALEARIVRLLLSKPKLKVRYQKNDITVDISSVGVLDGAGKGRFQWKNQENGSSVSTTLSLSGFDASKSAALFQRKPFVQGRLNLETDLTAKGADLSRLLHHVRGTVRLAGTNLKLVSVNLDELVAKISKSQNYNLVDAAAYFFVGPMGMSVTKGYDFLDVAKEMKQPGITPNSILRMVSTWEVADGIATAKDVALETAKYRLALKGRINLVKNEFDNVRIAVINNRGCAIVSQQLDGPIASPRIEKTNILLKLTRPLLDILDKSTKLLIAGDCEPFYAGELLVPAGSQSTGLQKKVPGDKP